MKLIDPSVELLDEPDTYRKIELAGRTCYKSEANITSDSSKKFVDRLIKNKHYAMLEHGVGCFDVSNAEFNIDFLKQNRFTNYTEITELGESLSELGKPRKLLSLNLRVLLENQLFSPYAMKLFDAILTQNKSAITSVNIVSDDTLRNFHPNEILEHKYFTFRVVCDRGVSHEIMRHRLFSFAQESTRYVNYGKNADMLFIKPANYDNWDNFIRTEFIQAISDSEIHYKNLIELGCTPQLSRAVLPNSIKTEIIITGNLKEWIHFLNLRYKGTTGKPHPDMFGIAEKICNIIDKQGWFNLIGYQ